MWLICEERSRVRGIKKSGLHIKNEINFFQTFH